MCHFGEIDFWKNKMAYYSAHFQKKVYTQKIKNICGIQEKNDVCAHEFSWFCQKNAQEKFMYHIRLS